MFAKECHLCVNSIGMRHVLGLSLNCRVNMVNISWSYNITSRSKCINFEQR